MDHADIIKALKLNDDFARLQNTLGTTMWLSLLTDEELLDLYNDIILYAIGYMLKVRNLDLIDKEGQN